MARRFLQSAVLLLAAAAASAAETATPPSAPRRVLILTGTEVMLPASQVEDAAIRQLLAEADLGPIEFFSEGMDAFRFHSEGFEDEFAAFLARKYRERPFDLVFALSDLALSFLTKYRELWPNAPVVFTNVDDRYFDTRPRPAWSTGILDNDSIVGTVDLARTLQPDARRILIVTGVAGRETDYTAKVLKSLKPLRSRYEIAVRAGVPVADYPREFGGLSPDTILVYTMMFRDSAGRTVVPREAARALAAAASVPVYGAHATFLGGGILGGALFDYEYEGRAAAQMGVRILKGAAPSSIAVLPGSPPLRAVDARQLQRFGIPERRLPAGYEVRFRPPSFWVQYRRWIIGGAVAVTVETVLLIALLVERRQRRLAQEESLQRRRELAQAARLATVGELAASISHEINQPLGAILANAEAAGMLLEADDGQHAEVRQILEDIRRDDQRASEVVQRVRRLAGRREMEMRPLDVNAVVEVADRLLRYEARRHGVSVEKDLGRGIPAALGDEVSIQQVIINLALNGMEAMSEVPAERRRLLIRTRVASRNVAIRVSDAGPGIAAKNRPNLFQSFFTTKAEGVGLGLSICRSIVEAHGGRIEAIDEPAGGAAFEFTLPAAPLGFPPEPGLAAGPS